MANCWVHATVDLIVWGRSYLDLHRKKDRWSRTLGSAHRKRAHDWYWQFGKQWTFDEPFPAAVRQRTAAIRALQGLNAAEREQVLLTHDMLDRIWDTLSKKQRKYCEALCFCLLSRPDVLLSWAEIDVLRGRILRLEDGKETWRPCPALRDEYARLRAYADAVRAKDPQLRQMLTRFA
jgi:hypothetical protein